VSPSASNGFSRTLDDARVRAEADLIFLDELGQEFGFSPPTNAQELSALAASLPTVRALVEYVVQQTNPGE
jgi:hypothetical protein